MSYVSIGGVKNLQGLVSYVFYGNKLGAAERRKKDQERTVVSFCTMPITDFINRGNAIKIGKGLKYGAISLVQSFNNEKDGLDYTSKADQRYVNDLGYDLAHKLFPHSEIFVGTHIDGKNHMLHNHIIVLNYDPVTGRALTNERLYKIRAANDELMKEHDLSIIPKKSKQPVLTTYMTKNNLEKHGKNWVEKYDFDTDLKRRLDAILALKPANLEEYERLAQISGITVKQHEFGRKKKVTGLLYRMHDLVTKKGDLKPRERRRKASRLGTRYSTTGLNEFFKEVQKQPSDFTPKEKEIILSAKYAKPHNPASEKAVAELKLHAKSIVEAHKKPNKQPETQQQVTEPVTQNVALTASERAQVQQQRKLWIQAELAKIKQKLKTKLNQKKSELKRALNETLEKIEDKKLTKQNNKWSLYNDASITADEYSAYLDKTTNQAGKAKRKAKKKYQANIKQAQDEYDFKLEKSRKELEQQAKKTITEPIPDFDEKKHKNYLEKSLTTDNKKKQRNKHKKDKKKQQKDLDADGIDDEIEGIKGVVTDDGIIPTEAFDSDLNDADLNQFVTNFDNKGVTDTSAKQTTQPTTPKPKRQKSQASEDYSLQEQALREAKLDKKPEEYGVNDDLQY